MSDRYDDIISLPHHRSRTRRPMSAEMRAAQFAPFAALTGYDAIVLETARLTDSRPVLDDETAARLSDTINRLSEHIGTHPYVTLVCFVPDERKEGGMLVPLSGELRRIDLIGRQLTFTDGTRVDIDDICSISER